MKKGNSSTQRDSAQETHSTSEAAVPTSSHRPRNKVSRFLGKVKENVKSKISRSKNPRSSSPVPTNPKSALQGAQEAAEHLDSHSKVAETVFPAVEGAPDDLDSVDSVVDTYLKPLKIFETVITEIGNLHPYAKIALGVLSCAAKIILAQVHRDEAVLQLLKKISEVYNFVMEGDVLNKISSMGAILSKISQQTRECASFIKNYSETKNFWTRLGKNIISETTDTIQKYNDVFDELMQNFRDQAIRDVVIHVHDMGEKLDLIGMTYAEGAGLDTNKECLEGTRAEILSQIKDWVSSTGDNVPRVLWLSGPAGKGKSAIAHTIAKWFKEAGGLGSCYCFDRQREADRRHEKIFSTIARDLADHDPEMRRALADAVKIDIALKTTADVIQQWQKLLMKSLEKSSGQSGEPIVITIDALDESGGVETREVLLRILAGKHPNPAVPKITDLPRNFRFIVTSRALDDIKEEFDGVPHIQQISMDDIPPAFAERDIYTYVSQKLEGLGLQDREFKVLAEKADGLFEWARLACGYIKKFHTGLSRRECYNAVVSRDPTERRNLLYTMYDLILTDIMPRDTSEKQRLIALARFRSVMGQILGTAEPLPLASLTAMRRHFPTQEDIFEVELVVKSMGSLLSGTTSLTSPIRPLHASFHDFLTDQQSSKEFFVDLSKSQRDLAFASLRVMADGLCFNICDLKSSYLPNDKDPGLQERVQERISPHLSYSSRFWTSHIRDTVFDKELAKEVKMFFDHERLFFWIELLGLKKALSSAAAALLHIAQWLKGNSEFKDVSSNVMDVRRFIQVFCGMILHSTPHLYVSALPFSPSNSPLSRKFSAQFPNTLRIAFGRDMNWPAVQTVLSGHTDSVSSVAFSPDGTRIVTGSWDETVRLWDAATGQPVGEPLRGHTSSVWSVSFSPDGTRIATGSDDHTVRLWDAATGQPIGDPIRGHTKRIKSVSFSPDGTRIISGSWDRTVRLWDAATGQPVGEPLRGHTGSINSVSFSPDGIYIVSGSHDRTVRLWDAATGQPVGEPLRGHTDPVYSVSFSSDGTRIFTGSRDNTILLWDAATGQPIGEPLRHIYSVYSLSFSPDGTRIVTGSHDRTIRLWDVATGQPVGEPLRGHTDPVEAVSFSPDGTRIVSGSWDNTVRLWDTATGQLVNEPLWGHTDSVISVSFSPNGTRIVTGSRDTTVRLWCAATGQPVGEPLEGHTGQITSVSFSPDGTRIVTGSYDCTVRLWDAATGQPVGEPLRHMYSVYSLSFSPDGTHIITSPADCTVQLWDAATEQPVGEPLRGHTDLVKSVSFSSDGTRIVTGSDDHTVRLWDVATGKPVSEPLLGHTDSVVSVSFSPDGTRIVSGSHDCTVRLWDAATGQPVGEPLRGHTGGVTSVSFSSDGTRIVTGSYDHTIRLWDVATGQPVGEPLRGHTHSVNSVSFSSDDIYIVSGSSDNTVRLWDLRLPSQHCALSDPSPSSDEHRANEAATTMTSNTRNNHFISFSSNCIHALCNTFELMEEAPDEFAGEVSGDESSSTPFVLNVDSGWVVGPKCRLLFWVPPASRPSFWSPRTALVIPRGIELDLSHMTHGQHWQMCRDLSTDDHYSSVSVMEI